MEDQKLLLKKGRTGIEGSGDIANGGLDVAIYIHIDFQKRFES